MFINAAPDLHRYLSHCESFCQSIALMNIFCKLLDEEGEPGAGEGRARQGGHEMSFIKREVCFEALINF